jgi:hypothetical protein
MQRSALKAGKPRKARGPWPKTVAKYTLILITVALVCFFTLTDAAPRAEERPAPTAQQVGAGRDAVLQLRPTISAPGNSSRVRLRPVHLDGLSALATHGFRPDRLDLSVAEQALHVHASHKLAMGRWLNVRAEVRPSGTGFPEVRAKVGAISLSPWLSRLTLDAARFAATAFGADIPPLDDLVQQFGVEEDTLVATVQIPNETGLMDRITGGNSSLDADLVSATYCRLADAQAADPQNDFAVQVRRAFPAGRVMRATPESNRAALVALAMAVVDTRVGDMARVDQSAIAGCVMPEIPIVLHGRRDLPKHWALSAALEVVTGRQFAQSMGEWKELSDSLSRKSEFQSGDPTGFSFVDIAANRSGLRTAIAANSASSAGTMAARLSLASGSDILPPSLVNQQEGAAFDFARAYGDIQDPRFTATMRQIDQVLDREGLTRKPY